MNRWRQWIAVAILLPAIGCKNKSSKQNPSQQADESAKQPVIANLSHAQEVIVIRQVLAEESSVDPRWDLDPQSLATRLGSQLLASGRMVPDESDVPATKTMRRAEVRLLLNSHVTLPTEGSDGNVVVAIEAIIGFIDGSDDLRPRAAVLIEVPLKTLDDQAIAGILSDLTTSTLTNVGESLIAQEVLRSADSSAQMTAISGDDSMLRVWAMKLVAEQKLREAVPLIVSALSHEDPDTQRQAVTALVAIGDERAVPALTKLADFKDYVQLAVTMEAVSAIGGADAIDFLEFVASGHPSEELRERAAASLLRIQGLGREIP